MVLTQRGRTGETCPKRVSIPLWFSRNLDCARPVLIPLVSIPLWFSRNCRKSRSGCSTQKRFHTTMVLTQQEATSGRLVKFYVSIPLWFSRNYCVLCCYIQHLVCFHTTMVLTQRAMTTKEFIDWTPFPYHYGSHATRRMTVEEFINCFHTTMVLTQHIMHHKISCANT